MITKGGGGMKIAAKKSNCRFQFFWRNFRHPSRVLRWLQFEGGNEKSVRGWITKIVTEKIEPTFSIFSSVICHPISLINSFQNLKFSKMFGEDTTSRIRRSCDCDGGKLGDENRDWKNRKRQFDPLIWPGNLQCRRALRWKKQPQLGKSLGSFFFDLYSVACTHVSLTSSRFNLVQQFNHSFLLFGKN